MFALGENMATGQSMPNSREMLDANQVSDTGLSTGDTRGPRADTTPALGKLTVYTRGKQISEATVP